MAAGNKQAEENLDRSREAVRELLIEKIRADRYPSATMMYLAESQLTEQTLPDYLDMLLDKITRDRYPSMDLIRRYIGLTQRQPARRVPGAVVGGCGVREPTRM